MISTARKIRGSTIIADAFFPLAILNFGQTQVLLWWWQVNHVLAPITATLLLSVLVLHGNDLQSRQAGLIAVGLILLVLCGPGGFPYALAFAVWLAYWLASQWRSLTPLQRRHRSMILAPTVAALALLAFYFVDYKPNFPVNDPPTRFEWPPSPGVLASATASLQVLGVSLGTATKPLATLSGLALFALGCVTLAVLIFNCVKHPSERSRALGLILFLGAAAVLVLVVGISRAGMGLDYIYQGHYLPLGVPALCCIYIAWEIRAGRAARGVQVGMFAVLAALLPLNLREAVRAGQEVRQKTTAFERDVRKRIPAFVLAERHFTSDAVPRAEKLDLILRSHKANGIGIFKEIRDDPPFQVETLHVEDALLDRMNLHDGILSSAGDSNGMSSLTFALPEARHIYAVRLHYAYIKTGNSWPRLSAFWRNSAIQQFNSDAAWFSIVAGPDQPTWALIDGKIQTHAKVRTDRTLTIWIDATMDQIRIYPDSSPCEFRLSGIQLLVPAG
jgi:hypothetical protein